MMNHSQPVSDQRSPTISPDRSARLNIFALPSRTNILFALIIIVIWFPVLASLIDDTPVCEPFILFWMLLLPLRDFLRYPDQVIHHGRMTDLASRFPVLAQQIDHLAAWVGLRRTPHLLLARANETGLHAFGSFTRHYLAIPIDHAIQLQANLESSDQTRSAGAEAILLHELSHFVHRDIVPTFFVRSLLWVTVVFMLFSLLTNLPSPFLYNLLIDFYDIPSLWPPEFLQLLTELNPQIAQLLLNPPKIGPAALVRWELFVFTAHWPLIVGSLMLFLFFWRALLRTRELYADARVAQWQGTAEIIRQEMLRAAVRAAIRPLPRFPRLYRWARQATRFLAARPILSFLTYHPDWHTRQGCLNHPEQLYGSDLAIAATAGFTVVLLNLTLGSLFISRYLRGPNATIPFILGFVLLSISLLPHVCVDTGQPPALRHKIMRLVLIFTGIKLVPQYILGLIILISVMLNPEAIEWAAYTLTGVGGEAMPPLGIPVSFVIEVYVLRPAILFTFVMPLTLVVWLLLDAWLKRMVLTWYGAPVIAKYPVALFWGLTGWLALLLWFVVLPVYNVATVPTAHTLLEPLILVRMALTLLLSIVIVTRLITTHRRYSGRCPRCAGQIPGFYRPGMSCSHCGELFHPWLLACY